MDSSKVGFLGRGLVEFGLFGTNDLMQYKTSEFENKVFCCFFIQKFFNECENSVTYEKKNIIEIILFNYCISNAIFCFVLNLKCTFIPNNKEV